MNTEKDIKPSNILVTTTSESRAAPRVIDYAVAKATACQQLMDKTIFTAHEMLIGTPAFAMDIRRHLTGEAVLACPPGARYKLQKLFLRNRLLFTCLGLIFLLLIVALALTTRLVITQRRQLKLADAIQLETRAVNCTRDSNPDAAEATLRESLADRWQYLGEPPTTAAEFVANGMAASLPTRCNRKQNS